MESRAHDPETLSSILTLGVNPFPYLFIIRTDLPGFFEGVFAPLSIKCRIPLRLRKL